MKKIIFTNLIAAVLLPVFVHAQSIAPANADQTYSIVTITPDVRGNAKLEALTEKIKSKVGTISQQVMQTATNGLLQPKTLNTAFATMAIALQTELQPFAQEINKDLPEDAVVFTTYIMPYTIDEKAEKSQLPLLNEVQVIEKNIGEIAAVKKSAVAEFYAHLRTQISDISPVKSSKFQFIALAAHLKLARNRIEVQFQMLGELKSGSTDFDKVNKQVVLSQLDVLSDEAHNLRPMALMEVTQLIPIKESDKTEMPQIRLEFGAFGGLSGGLLGWKGALQIFNDPITPENTCRLKIKAVPSLFGFFAEEATGILPVDKFLHNKAVRFRIMSMNIDAKTQRVSSMKVATGLDDYPEYQFLSCLLVASVGAQFTDEANIAIEDALKDITSQNDVTPELMQALYE